YGVVEELGAGIVRASGPATGLGQLCEIVGQQDRRVMAEVVAVGERGITLIPLEPEAGLRLGARVVGRAEDDRAPRGDGFAGRAIDALGRPIDGRGTVASSPDCASEDVAALDRINPAATLTTGIRAIDGLLTLGVGQRIGIFAASGVGKTTLVEQLARQ